MFFASAFDSAFFSRRRTNLTDFSGQRPVTRKLWMMDDWDGGLHTLGGLELLGLACASDTAREAAVGYDLLVLADVRKVSIRLCELEACVHPLVLVSQPIHHPLRTSQSSRNLPHVFEVSPQVLAPGAGSWWFNQYLTIFWADLDRLFSGLAAVAAAA